MLVHRPQPVRPVEANAGYRHQRPIQILDLRPDFHRHTRRGDRARIPGQRRSLPGALAPVGKRFLGGLAAFFNRRLAVVGDRRLDRLDQRGKRRFGIRRHRHVDGLEALEVLIVRLGQQLRGVDADELGLGFDPARIDPDAVLAVVDIGVHGRPEVGQLEAEDDVGVADRRGRTV